MDKRNLNIDLYHSIKAGFVDEVEELINSGGDVNSFFNGYSMLSIAAYKLFEYQSAIRYDIAYPKYFKIIDLLLKNGAIVHNTFNVDFIHPFKYNIHRGQSNEMLRKWFLSYEFQKQLANNLDVIIEMNDYNYLHPELKKEFAHIFTADELNLL